MKCSRCNKNEATVFYKQNINGDIKEFALCSECASSHEHDIYAPFVNLNLFGVKNIPVSEKKRCNLCGSSFDDIRREGKVGCGKCYETFEKELRSTINSIHGTSLHEKRIPKEIKEINDEIDSLKKELKAAIENEEYERAAILRDKIKEKEGNL